MSKFIDSIVSKIATRVSDELIKHLPELADLVVNKLPDIAEEVTDQILDHLPFPFRHTKE